MSLGTARLGLNSVDAFMAPGVPGIVSVAATTTKTLSLKYVANEVTIVAVGGPLTANFGLTNSANITLAAGMSITVRAKIKKIAVSAGTDCTATIIVSVTNVESMQCPTFDQQDYGTVT